MRKCQKEEKLWQKNFIANGAETTIHQSQRCQPVLVSKIHTANIMNCTKVLKKAGILADGAETVTHQSEC